MGILSRDHITQREINWGSVICYDPNDTNDDNDTDSDDTEADPGFPVGGSTNPPEGTPTHNFANFSQILRSATLMIMMLLLLLLMMIKRLIFRHYYDIKLLMYRS